MLPTETPTPSPTSPPSSPRRVPLPRVVAPTSKGGEDLPIATRMQARTLMPTPSATPNAATNLPHNHQVSQRTRSRTPADTANMIMPHKAASRVYSKAFLTMLAMPVMDEETGQILNYLQIRTHPKFSHIWNQLYSNEM